jgi:hypothetical protein
MPAKLHQVAALARLAGNEILRYYGHAQVELNAAN